MSSLSIINQGAEQARAKQALAININAARSLQSILCTNLGPRGTLKMLVSGGGDIKLTKDGQVLLKEMQITHPTATLIARTATSQDNNTGDGTSSIVITIGELLYQSQRFLSEGMHPSGIIEGIELARKESIKFLESFKEKYQKEVKLTKEVLINVAKTALKTKIHHDLADKLSTMIVDGLEIIKQEGKKLDLFMVEIMEMENRTETDVAFIKGLVLDHGARHPDMKKKLKNCYVLTCNVSLEYEKTEINSVFNVKDSKKRQELIEAERKTVDDKVRKIIELKKEVCATKEGEDEKNFIVINQKGIDPLSLDMLAKAGITALRRAKRRNMERLTLACGGKALNSLETLSIKDLGWCGSYHEETIGEEKYAFVEDVKDPHSCTILVKGPNKFTIDQIKDAIRDGLHSVTNTLEDNVVLPGAGCFEVALSTHLNKYSKEIKGRPQLGVKAFAEAVLIIPKTLAQNSGFDVLDTLLNLQQEHEEGNNVGLDLFTGLAMDPINEGVFDSYRVKQQIIDSSAYTSCQLLYIDEILRAGKQRQKLE